MKSRVKILNYVNYYWDYNGIFITYLVDKFELRYKILIDKIIKEYPKNNACK